MTKYDEKKAKDLEKFNKYKNEVTQVILIYFISINMFPFKKIIE